LAAAVSEERTRRLGTAHRGLQAATGARGEEEEEKEEEDPGTVAAGAWKC